LALFQFLTPEYVGHIARSMQEENDTIMHNATSIRTNSFFDFFFIGLII
jgi:hypothetical protein